MDFITPSLISSVSPSAKTRKFFKHFQDFLMNYFVAKNHKILCKFNIKTL